MRKLPEYGAWVPKTAKRLDKMFEAVQSPSQAQRIRERLNDFAGTLSNDKKGVAQLAIKILKDKFKLDGKIDDYILTDHAFCRMLERCYNVNMVKLKDIVYKDFKDDRRFNFIEKEGFIISVIKRIN